MRNMERCFLAAITAAGSGFAVGIFMDVFFVSRGGSRSAEFATMSGIGVVVERRPYEHNQKMPSVQK